MSILQHNGAAIVCMAGKNCVAIASDTRFGLSQQTVSCDFQKVFKQSDRLFWVWMEILTRWPLVLELGLKLWLLHPLDLIDAPAAIRFHPLFQLI